MHTTPATHKLTAATPTNRPRRWSHRACPHKAALVGVALMVAACGAATATTPGATPSGGSSPKSAVAYAACMRSHGVPDFPDPNSQGQFAGVNLPAGSPQLQSAQSACRNLLPGGGGETTGGNAGLTSQQQAQLLTFAKCMRSHGVPTFPDPSSQGLDLGSGNIDPNSPQFQSAQTACKADLPGGGSGSTTGGGSGGSVNP